MTCSVTVRLSGARRLRSMGERRISCDSSIRPATAPIGKIGCVSEISAGHDDMLGDRAAQRGKTAQVDAGAQDLMRLIDPARHRTRICGPGRHGITSSGAPVPTAELQAWHTGIPVTGSYAAPLHYPCASHGRVSITNPGTTQGHATAGAAGLN